LSLKEKEEEEEDNEKTPSSSMSFSTTRARAIQIYKSYSDKMQARLTDPVKAALRKGSVFALTFLDKDKWENEVPEYMRPKPKYFYYYEWMKDRIKEYYPELPQCVLDKLLSLDGAELDLLLQHPQAIRGQTEEFLQVLDEKGEKFLETYKTPQLSWEEVQALRVSEAKKKKLLENQQNDDSDYSEEEDTDHAMIGASGDDGLTKAEKLGKPILPLLPPDQRREKAKLDALKRDMAKDSQKLLQQNTTRKGGRVEDISDFQNENEEPTTKTAGGVLLDAMDWNVLLMTLFDERTEVFYN